MSKMTNQERTAKTLKAYEEHKKKFPAPMLDMDRNPVEQLQELAEAGDEGAKRELKALMRNKAAMELWTGGPYYAGPMPNPDEATATRDLMRETCKKIHSQFKDFMLAYNLTIGSKDFSYVDMYQRDKGNPVEMLISLIINGNETAKSELVDLLRDKDFMVCYTRYIKSNRDKNCQITIDQYPNYKMIISERLEEMADFASAGKDELVSACLGLTVGQLNLIKQYGEWDGLDKSDLLAIFGVTQDNLNKITEILRCLDRIHAERRKKYYRKQRQFIAAIGITVPVIFLIFLAAGVSFGSVTTALLVTASIWWFYFTTKEV